MRIKRNTRIISFLLAILTILSILPIDLHIEEHVHDHIHDEYIAYADQSGYNGGGAGLQGFGSSHLSNWGSNKQGVRMSIVNADKQNVLSTSYSAVDFLFQQLPDESKVGIYYMYGNKFQNYSDGYAIQLYVNQLNTMLNKALDDLKASGAEIKLGKLPEYDSLIGTYEGLPKPVIYYGNNKFEGNGNTVRQFFVQGTFQETVTYYPTYIPTVSGVTGQTTTDPKDPQNPQNPTPDEVGGASGQLVIRCTCCGQTTCLGSKCTKSDCKCIRSDRCSCCGQVTCIGKEACTVDDTKCTCLQFGEKVETKCLCCGQVSCIGREAHTMQDDGASILDCYCVNNVFGNCKCCKQIKCLGASCTNQYCTCARGSMSREEIATYISQKAPSYITMSYEGIAATGKIETWEKQVIKNNVSAVETYAKDVVIQAVQRMIENCKRRDRNYWEDGIRTGEIYNKIENYGDSYEAPLERALSGQASYEYVIGNNKLVNTVPDVAIDIIQLIQDDCAKRYSVASSNALAYLENWLAELKAKKVIAVSSRVKMDASLSMENIHYNEIPLASADINNNKSNPLLDSLSKIADDVASSTSTLLKSIVDACLEESQTAITKIEALVNGAFGDNDKYFWESLSETKTPQSLYLGVINAANAGSFGPLKSQIETADKTTQLLGSSEGSNVSGLLDGLDTSGSSHDNTGGLSLDEYKDQLGQTLSQSTGTITVAAVKVILNNILIQLHDQGLQVTYYDLLSLLAGEDEFNKLQVAATNINQWGIEAWLAGLDINSLFEAYDDGSKVMSALYENDGYIGAILDMRDPTTNEYLFKMEVADNLKEDYLKACQVNGTVNDMDRPSRIFSYCGYGLVLEPLYWIKPVSRNGNSWKVGPVTGSCSCHGTLYQCDWYVYGTVTNWARWKSASVANYQEEIGHLSLHFSMAEAMFIKDEIDFFVGGTVDDGIIPGLPDYLYDGDVGGEYSEARKDLTNSYSYRLFRERVSQQDSKHDHFAYGWHFIGAPSRVVSQQVTWNGTVPSPGPAPDPSKLPDPSKRSDGTPTPPDPENGYPNGYPSKRFNIVKYYRTIEETYQNGVLIKKEERKDLREGPTIRRDNPNIIRVVDEPEYKVIDWYTTGNENLPPENDKSQDYFANKASDNPVQSQTTPALVTLDKGNDKTETTLVVLLEKVIRKDDNTQQQNPGLSGVTIEQSQLYKTIHTNSPTIKSITSNANWNDYEFKFKLSAFNPKTTKGYHQAVTGLDVLYQPTIPGCNNSTPVIGRQEPIMDIRIDPFTGQPYPYQSGTRTYYSGAVCQGHDHSYFMPGGSGDNKLEFKFRGLHSLNDGGLEIDKGIHPLTDPKVYSKDGNHPKETNTLDEVKYQFNKDGQSNDGADYVSVIWRYQDVPTMPTYKENDIRERYGDDNWEVPNTLLHMDINTPKLTRQDNGDQDGGDINFKFGIDKSISDLRVTASCNGIPEKYADCFHTSLKQVELDGTPWDYEFKADVVTRVYRGVDKELADMPFTGTGETKKEEEPKKNYKYMVLQNSQTISFYPYIKMTYMTNTLDQAIQEDAANGDVRYETYVFAEQLSKILPSDAAEVGWTGGAEGNLNITSQQWSLHQKAVNGSKVWQGKNQVLPGGAIYQLDTDGGHPEVEVISYQTVVDQATRSWLSPALTGDEYTEAKVQEDHKTFVETAWDVLDNLKVVQWVTSEDKVGENTAWPKDFDESKANEQMKVYEGNQSLSPIKLTTKTNTDDKYYMNKANEGTEASQGDLDILKAKQETTIYKVFADTEGKIYLATLKKQTEKLDENKKAPASGYIAGLVAELEEINADTMSKATGDVSVRELFGKQITSDQVLAQLNGDIKKVEERTSFITNFVKSLERNTGEDSTAKWAKADGKWYNEAFDGFYMVVQKSILEIGFHDPAKRSTALDPALCPSNSGQSDLYTSAIMSQFCLDSKSDSALAQGKDKQYLSTFRGEDIILPNMQGMYTTRKFYIPNANVQDLN